MEPAFSPSLISPCTTEHRSGLRSPVLVMELAGWHMRGLVCAVCSPSNKDMLSQNCLFLINLKICSLPDGSEWWKELSPNLPLRYQSKKDSFLFSLSVPLWWNWPAALSNLRAYSRMTCLTQTEDFLLLFLGTQRYYSLWKGSHNMLWFLLWRVTASRSVNIFCPFKVCVTCQFLEFRAF